MGSSPKSPKVEISEEEQVLAQQAQRRWARYQENGIPIQNEHIARQTGLRLDDDGNVSIDPEGILNSDGSVRTDSAASDVANERAFTDATLQSVDPNRFDNTNEIQRDGARQGAAGATSIQLEQQTAQLQGVQNAARLAQGLEGENIANQSQLANQAQTNATNAAARSLQSRNTQAGIAGTLAGTGAALAFGRSPGLGQASPAPPTSNFLNAQQLRGV